VPAETTETKQCSKCGEIKLLNSFYRNKSSKDGLKSQCKICFREYYRNNRGSKSRYYQSNRDRILQRQKKWCQDNRESISRWQNGWRQDNRDKVRAQKARRRAAKRNATPSWADKAAIDAIYAEALWLQDFTGEPCHVDHIVPLKSDFLCGLHVPANLQTLPGVENLAKGNRSWPGQLPCQTRRGIDHQWWKELYARTIALKE